jgi:lipopolysaccharide biosynthesis protein
VSAAPSPGPVAEGEVRAIAFYLPQFHPIPENDAWWGAGFTEWSNVSTARPLFPGHHQPHRPADLGYYDLRLPETREAQARMAGAAGLSGFCWYHYWFNGRRLLERPFDEVLASGSPDFPFCLCWANESWTRRWDGLEREVLMPQRYETYDADAHFEHLAPAFADARYLTVRGRPLFVVYRVDAIPHAERVVEAWRRAAVRLGVADPYLVSVQSSPDAPDEEEARALGFDACCEFYPNQWVTAGSPLPARALRRLRRSGYAALSRASSWETLRAGARPDVWPYREMVRYALAHGQGLGHTFPGVAPSWDNTARRRRNPKIVQNDDPRLYGQWLDAALARAAAAPPGERLVFINAWNEWAEGCHLEPDRRHGHAFLDATRSAVDAVRARSGSPESAPAGLNPAGAT